MKIAIDTNRYVDFCRGHETTVRIVRQADQLFVCLVTLAELRAGFLCGDRSVRNQRALTGFLNSPRVTVLQPDEQTTHHYARIFQQLRRQGTPLPTNDIWLAASVVQHDLVLCSRDKHFDHLPQIPRI